MTAQERMYKYIFTFFFLIILTGCIKNESESAKVNEHNSFYYGNSTVFPQYEPSLQMSIADTDDELKFGSINQIQVMSDGSIIAFDPTMITVHHFDDTGGYLSNFGREGSGPGEFSQQAHIKVDSNRVYIFEQVTYKIDIFEHHDQSWVHQQTILTEKVDDDYPYSLLHANESGLWMTFRYFYQGDNGARLEKNILPYFQMTQKMVCIMNLG